MQSRYKISPLALISGGLAALFGTDPIGFPQMALPYTGNQRGRELRAAQHKGVRMSAANGYHIHRKTGAIINPRRNAERKAYRAARAADRLRGTADYNREHAHG